MSIEERPVVVQKARERLTLYVLLALAAVASFLTLMVLWPFWRPIITAALIAVAFSPIHESIHLSVRKRNLAALFSTIIAALLIVVPLSLIGFLLFAELSKVYEDLAAARDRQGGWSALLFNALDRPLAWLGAYVNLSTFDVQNTIRNWLQQASGALVKFGSNLVTGAVHFIANLFFTMFTLFFLLRDGGRVKDWLHDWLPLAADQIDHMLDRLTSAVSATVYGALSVGFTQGLLTGLTFWILGLPSPVFWGVMTGVLSQIPFVGAAGVWLPASILLFANGRIREGAILVAIGVLVISMADNVIRPLVISERVNISPLAVFFSLLGGVQAFGAIGLFTGPVIWSLTVNLFQLVRDEVRRLRAIGGRVENTIA
jgi:predicted PurR-regulated permease PerM